MHKADKEAFVADFERRIAGAQAFYLTDFTGLDVQAMSRLRVRLKEIGAEYLVVKNRLALRALRQLGLPDIADYLKGPTGVVIGYDGPVEAARVLREFALQHEQRPAVKVGVVAREVVGPTEIERIAKLPPREQLLAELAGALEAPLAALAAALEAKLREMAGLLDALRERKASS